MLIKRDTEDTRGAFKLISKKKTDNAMAQKERNKKTKLST